MRKSVMCRFKGFSFVLPIMLIFFLSSAWGADISIDGGGDHTMVVRDDETVWCWGNNESGQLGNGIQDGQPSTVPVRASGLMDVRAVAAGRKHSAALKNDGTVWTWGENSSGQLGDGTNTNSSQPVKTNGLSNITAISAGNNHTVALGGDKTVWTWGNNDNGQLGYQTTSNTPTKVSGLSNVIAIAADSEHTMALKNDGSLWAWGKNSSGQIGNGTNDNVTAPVKISGISNVSAIAAGGNHSAAVSDGKIWIWGSGTYGQLGNGTTENSNTPAMLSDLDNVSSVAATSFHTAILMDDGTVRACGAYGTADGRVDHLMPTEIAELSDITAIGAGESHMMAIMGNRSVWTWGRSTGGLLGNGSDGAGGDILEPEQADISLWVFPNAIASLQVAIGISPVITMSKDNDVSGDGNVGVEEAVFFLRVTAGMIP